jgi:cytochrome P450
VRFRIAPRRAYLVVHPDHVRQVLYERRTVYRRDRWHAAQLQETSGHGLTASEGGLWREQRRLLRPTFHGEQDARQARAAFHATARMVERWAGIERRGEAVDLHEEMLRLSLEVIAEALFSVDLEHESSRIVRAASVVLDRLYRRLRMPLPAMARLPSPGDAGFRMAREVLYDLAARLLEERVVDQPTEDDLLAVLGGYADRGLAQDQIVTMILAGHDTTGTALAWAGHMVASHPAVDRRLHAEAAQHTRGGDHNSLVYARSVFRETLRLYPPAWVLSRTPAVREAIGGYAIPAGATVFISPFITHRHPDFWVTPERFDPERFAERAGARHPYAYLPFGAGPRMCIGKAFAETTGQIVLSTIARSYRLRPVSVRPISLRPQLTLRPRGGVRVHLLRRADER